MITLAIVLLIAFGAALGLTSSPVRRYVRSWKYRRKYGPGGY